MNIPIFIHESSDAASAPFPIADLSPSSCRKRPGRMTTVPAAAGGEARTSKKSIAGPAADSAEVHRGPTATAPAEQTLIYRFDQADYAALARRYAALLRQGLLDDAMPVDQRAFCRRLLDDLEVALAQYGTGRLREQTPDCRFDAEMELQWLCNQCRHYFGDAVSPALRWSGARVDLRGPHTSVTDGELAAISCLFAISRVVASRSTDRAAWRRQGGGIVNIFKQRLRETLVRIAVWLRRRGSAAKAFLRRDRAIQSIHANPSPRANK